MSMDFPTRAVTSALANGGILFPKTRKVDDYMAQAQPPSS